MWPWSASAHFVLFAIIAAIPAYGKGTWNLAPVLGLAVGLAAATEFLQQFVPGRHPLLRDALIDLSGTISGLVLTAALRIRKNGR
jgi:VanZ family protein